jgi:hypothetical protein
MKLQKVLILGTGSFLFLFFILFVLFFSGKQKPVSVFPTPTPASSTSQLVYPTISYQPSLAPYTPPSSDRIRIKDVVMDNFYKNAKETVGSDVLITQTPTYSIAFLGNFKTFVIRIEASPFLTYKITAENEFLRLLHVTESDACKLHVEVTTLQSINPDFAGIRHPLRFCQK